MEFGFVITSELIDPEEAANVLDEPEIFDRITDDTCPEAIEWPDTCTYYGGYVDGELASVSVVHETERGRQFHFQVLRPFREYKDELATQALDYFGVPLWCEIPDLYPQVYKIARRFGFREVEVMKDHYLKNGERYDSRILELR